MQTKELSRGIAFGQFKREMDACKRTANNGKEYWMGRDLQKMLAYADWRKFEDVIERAKSACEAAGFKTGKHFVQTDEMVDLGNSAKGTRGNYYLSKYACHLIAMNGQSSKSEIGAAQAYFSWQTHKQELFDDLSEDQHRLRKREELSQNVKNINKTVSSKGVKNFARFHDAGYRGQYDMPLSEIKKKKGIGEKEVFYDRINESELAANDFRITQTDARLSSEGITGENDACKIHRDAGEIVRKAMIEISGIKPENLPAVPHIKTLLKNPENKKFMEEFKQNKALPDSTGG